MNDLFAQLKDSAKLAAKEVLTSFQASTYDHLNKIVMKKVTETENRAKANEEQLINYVKDSKGIRTVACNVLFYPGTTVSPTLALTLGLSDEEMEQKLHELASTIHSITTFQPLIRSSSVRVPKNGTSTPFYRMCFMSEKVADEVRSYWDKFRPLGFSMAEDLTAAERKERSMIRTIMLSYWGRTTIPNSRFSRGLLKAKCNGVPGFYCLREI